MPPPAVNMARQDILPTFNSQEGYFIENRGQVDDAVRYYSMGNPSVAFRDDGVMFLIRESQGESIETMRDTSRATISSFGKPPAVRSDAYLVHFEQANRVAPVGVDLLPFKSNFLIGSDRGNWKTSLPVYGEVVYASLYAGIDLIYSQGAGGVKYQFIVHPGADEGRIAVTYEGVEALNIQDGELVIRTSLGDMRDIAPIARQNGKEVGCSFILLSGFSYGFDCARGDDSGTLVIDPLIYATYLGGSDRDQGQSIAVDSAGSAYVTGATGSADFPNTTGVIDNSYGGSLDSFVVKLSPNGSAIEYATFFGGSAEDDGMSIALDRFNNAYVAGVTDSTDLPTTPGAFQTSFSGGQYDCFVAKLDAAGSALLYSTYLGGSAEERCYSVAVNESDAFYVTGYTGSADYPISPGAYDQSFGGGWEGFITGFDPSGLSLIYSTYLGGSSVEFEFSIAVDSSGNAYVTGMTMSADFPVTLGAFDTMRTGGTSAYVTKMNPAGTDLVYSTFLDGSGAYNEGLAIQIDSTGHAYVTGDTMSTDFPTTSGAFDVTFNGASDVFVAEVDTTGSSLIYSTFLGGPGDDVAWSIAVNPFGNVWVTGRTGSGNFPTTPDAVDRSHGGNWAIFVSGFNETGSNLTYSTIFGDNGYDSRGYGIAADAFGSAYVTGIIDWPADYIATPGAYDTTLGGDEDAFVAMFGVNMPPVAEIDIAPNLMGDIDTVFTFNGSASYDIDGQVVSWQWMFGDGQSAGGRETTHRYLGKGQFTVSLTVTDDDGAPGGSSSSVSIVNRQPIANAGQDRIVDLTGSMILNGSASTDPDGDQIFFDWTQISGPYATIVDATQAVAMFTPPLAAVYEFVLNVSDPDGLWDTDMVALTVLNSPPTIDVLNPPKLKAGEEYNITWTMSDNETPTSGLVVYLNYSYGGSVCMIAGPLKGKKSFSWTVPPIEAADVSLNATVIDEGGLRNWSTTAKFEIYRETGATPPPNPVDPWWLWTAVVAVAVALVVLFMILKRRKRKDKGIP